MCHWVCRRLFQCIRSQKIGTDIKDSPYAVKCEGRCRGGHHGAPRNVLHDDIDLEVAFGCFLNDSFHNGTKTASTCCIVVQEDRIASRIGIVGFCEENREMALWEASTEQSVRFIDVFDPFSESVTLTNYCAFVTVLA